MAYTVVFEAPTTPETVMHALQHAAAYWQESITPAALKRGHILSVDLSGSAKRFELYGAYSQRPPLNRVALTGHLTATNSGKRVTVRIGLMGTRSFAVAIAALLSFAWFASDRSSAIIFASIALVLGVVLALLDRAIQPGRNEVADYLVERLRIAMQSIGAHSVRNTAP